MWPGRRIMKTAMRFEIVIPDNSQPELQAQFLSLTQKLSAQPELINSLIFDQNEEIQSMFTSERLAHIERSLAEVDKGKFLTSEQVNTHFAAKDSGWMKNNLQ